MPKRVLEPTAVPGGDGYDIVIDPIQVYADDHPLVKAHPGMFVEAFDESSVIAAPARAKSSKVEQATAAPGEKR